MIQSDLQCNQREFLKQIYDLALTSNATQAQLVLYYEALGMHDHEMKCCHKSSPTRGTQLQKVGFKLLGVGYIKKGIPCQNEIWSIATAPSN